MSQKAGSTESPYTPGQEREYLRKKASLAPGIRLHEPQWEYDRILYGARVAHILKCDNTGNELHRMYDQLIRLLNASQETPRSRTSTERFQLLRRAHVALYGQYCFGWEKGKEHPLGPNDELTIDHIKPKADGGTNERSNLTVMCADCNNTRGRFHQDQRRKGKRKRR